MTGRAAVLGHPISHSKSPALHRAAYARLGVELNYSAIDVTEAGLPAFMARVRKDVQLGPSWHGLSVTMPLKSAMVGEVDEVRGVARELGVVNTVAFERPAAGTGAAPVRLVGYNTDVAGIVNALRHAGAASAPAAAVLGGGGTAAAAIAALKELDAPAADIFVRDITRAREARAAAAALGLPVRVRPLEGASAALARADVVISTLPPRAADPLAEELARLFAQGAGGPAGEVRPGVLLDVAYEPWPSRIAAAWLKAGGVVVPGLEMLIYQAVEQVRHFTGLHEAVPAEVIDVMCDAVGAPRRVF
ncbi:NAD(P)-binding domain-containing protein [Arthrobacter sp. AL08]|uniref:shikimate dehydrogenase family protein n=1 Tax=unclassified Arthrobacter TaxID=235627 RepID=UPI00249AF9F5|nr:MULTISPECIES: NAD(P)-binding domain-containing protein [unclassified Arthrobacter]MDI3242856.1 NAD(P)-binding domain-containing protein [Arthrobacter sp. AL05]MDI3278881.1 NAD(P)-binding domain-containing protein [Arthrobacter sp. AL08]